MPQVSTEITDKAMIEVSKRIDFLHKEMNTKMDIIIKSSDSERSNPTVDFHSRLLDKLQATYYAVFTMFKTSVNEPPSSNNSNRILCRTVTTNIVRSAVLVTIKEQREADTDRSSWYTTSQKKASAMWCSYYSVSTRHIFILVCRYNK